MASLTEFQKELEHLINRTSQENGSDTPDWILAEYLKNCLWSFNTALEAREKWYGRRVTGVQSRPTIAELEEILQSNTDTPITVNPDGSISA